MTQDGSHFSLQRSLFQLPEIPAQINVGDFKCSPNTLGVNLQLLSSSREMWDSDGLQALYLLDLVARTAALLFIVDICSALHYLSPRHGKHTTILTGLAATGLAARAVSLLHIGVTTVSHGSSISTGLRLTC